MTTLKMQKPTRLLHGVSPIFHEDLVVGESSTQGKGLFITRTVGPDVYLGNMVGTKVPQGGPNTTHTIWLEHGGIKVSQQCCFRYINHNPHPNVEMLEVDGDVEIWTRTRLMPGDELFSDYSGGEGLTWEEIEDAEESSDK